MRLTADQVLALRQALRHRFGAAARLWLQDSLGEKVLPGILALTLDPLPSEATFAERLQRLERLGAIASADTWRLLREVRNSLAHHYPDQPAIQAAALNRPLRGIGQVLAAWSSVDRFVVHRMGAA